MEWSHTVSLDWMRARQQLLTASEIHAVVGVTESGRPRSAAAQLKAMRDLWARKQRVLTQEDCTSTGDMARGHVLEPYAVREFNRIMPDHNMLHVDDVIIESREHPGLGWSPDAVHTDGVPLGMTVCVMSDVYPITEMLEIKSYSAAHHYAGGLAEDVHELNERWQIATAFAVVPTLERAWLVHYNPSVVEKVFLHEFSREVLADEIEEVVSTAETWRGLDETLAVSAAEAGYQDGMTENEIHEHYEQEHLFNP